MVTLFSSFCAYQISGESAKRLNYGRDVNSCHTDSPYFSLRGEILGFCFSSAAERLFRVLFGVERRYSPCGFFLLFFVASFPRPHSPSHQGVGFEKFNFPNSNHTTYSTGSEGTGGKEKKPSTISSFITKRYSFKLIYKEKSGRKLNLIQRGPFLKL